MYLAIRFVLLIMLFPCLGVASTEKLYFDPQIIEVRRKDENSSVAKEKSLADAVRLAFKTLLESEHGRNSCIVDELSDKQISNCVYDYSVENEKYSDSFYIARLSYRFDRKKVEHLLMGKKSRSKDADGDKTSLKTGENIRVMIRARDFLNHSLELKKMDCKIEIFSKKRVIFTLDRSHLDGFKNIQIEYALLQNLAENEFQ